MRAALLCVGLLACGGGSDEPECPTDDCSPAGATVVKWRFHEYPQWSFPLDTCPDLDVPTVRVEAVNKLDPSLYFALDKECGQGQATFLRLPEGQYDVIVTPLDAAGNPLVSAGARGEVTAGIPEMLPTEVVVNVPYTAWTGTYTGTFLFNLKWMGMSCSTAAVATQTLRLESKGVVSDKVTDIGQKLDGSEERPCRTAEFSEFVEGLPMGPVTFTVTGKNAGGMVVFEKQFESFVGVGKNNPTFTFDVLAAPL